MHLSFALQELSRQQRSFQTLDQECTQMKAKLTQELQLPAYTTATVMQDSSRVCDLHHSLLQHQILNPLNEGRD